MWVVAWIEELHPVALYLLAVGVLWAATRIGDEEDADGESTL